MEGHHLHLHHQQQHQYGIQQIPGLETAPTVGVGAVSDRFPQWSVQETRDFLMIRADLDQAFLETKRNKLLWEVVANKMKEKGYNRSSEQCKCKWKNLVTRYKGCETMEPEGMRQQFQFYNELQAIFTARMHRMLWMEAEAGGSASGSKKKAAVTLSSSSEDEDQNDDSEGEKLLSTGNVNVTGGGRKKRKTKVAGAGGGGGGGGGTGGAAGLKEVLEEFMKQQVQIEMEWMKAYEAREEERQKREMEWRAKMESLEKERMVLERMWREREEQRRSREEARAERRDALITALLEKLRREGNV